MLSGRVSVCCPIVVLLHALDDAANGDRGFDGDPEAHPPVFGVGQRCPEAIIELLGRHAIEYDDPITGKKVVIVSVASVRS